MIRLINLVRVAICISLAFIGSASMENMTSLDKEQQSSKGIYVNAIVKGRMIIQLNITLLSPMVSVYDLYVTSVADNSEKFSHCNEMRNCRILGIPKETITSTLPVQNYFTTDNEKCIFQNECIYNISVKSVSGNSRFSVNYQIPECVNGRCLCRHADELPKPQMIPKLLSSTELGLEWEILSEAQNPEVTLQYLAIDIDGLNDCNRSWSTNHASNIAHFHETLDHLGLPIRKNDFKKDLNRTVLAENSIECLRIRMTVFDSQNCHGKTTEETLNIHHQNHHHAKFPADMLIVIALSALSTLATVLLIIYIFVWKRRWKNVVNYWRELYQHHGASPMPPMQENILYFSERESDEDWFEIPHSCIREIGREIGKGAFGRVFIARVSDIPGKKNFLQSQIVAIKKLKTHPNPEQLEEFVGEISTMKKVGRHQNIVRLLGFCTSKQPYMMIMEFVPCGDLLKYLRTVRAKHESTHPKANIEKSSSSKSNSSIKNSTSNHSQILGPLGRYLDILHSHSTSSASESSSYINHPDSHPSTQQINGSGAGTSRPSFAETMYTTVPSNPELCSMVNTDLEYVVDHKELHNFAIQIARGMEHLQRLRITHRDLAARNILIDENKTLKISDFGLSRAGIYVNTKNKKVPLRWLSIEAMKDNLYSSKSDVWAYSIVLWEIGTLGGFPYPTVSNHELLNFLKTGQRLEKPENCSDTLYELMLHCWATDPDDRPDFGNICETLDPNKNKIYIDFSELSPNYVFPPTSDELASKSLAEKLSKV